MFLSLQKKVSFEPATSYLLKNLKPFSTYTFQLAAKSKNGIGAYTNEVSIDTPQTRRSTCTDCSVCESVKVFVRAKEKQDPVLTMQMQIHVMLNHIGFYAVILIRHICGIVALSKRGHHESRP